MKEIRVVGKRHVPVMAMTAYALPGDRARFLDAGFDGNLPKPMMGPNLVAVLRSVASPDGERG